MQWPNQTGQNLKQRLTKPYTENYIKIKQHEPNLTKPGSQLIASLNLHNVPKLLTPRGQTKTVFLFKTFSIIIVILLCKASDVISNSLSCT